MSVAPSLSARYLSILLVDKYILLEVKSPNFPLLHISFIIAMHAEVSELHIKGDRTGNGTEWPCTSWTDLIPLVFWSWPACPTMDPTVLDILLLICISCMCSCCTAHFYPNSVKEPYCTEKSHACFFSSDAGLRPTLSSEYLHSNQHGASTVMEMRFWDDFVRNRAGETQNHWVKISCLSFLKLSSVVELLAFIWYCRFPAAKC